MDIDRPLPRSSVAAALSPGTTLGRFTLLRRLAVGGMAEIYLARSSGLEGFQKEVVLKRILPSLSADDEVVGMFLQEARVAATLRHPNIVQVFEMGIAEGSYYFTMEYVPGIDVRTMFRAAAEANTFIPFEQVMAIGAAAAAGLHHAHEQTTVDGRALHLVHRDVSPSNLLISDEGIVKVVDFGIAKAAVGHAETRTGSLKGKIAYMSPEQCKGLALDRRSDVFALGIVMHELLTGRRLYATSSDFETMTAIVTHDAPAPTAQRADCPRVLSDIVMKCLRRDPAQRWPTAQSLQLELERLAREERIDTTASAIARYVATFRKPEPLAEPNVLDSTATASASGESTHADRPRESHRPAVVMVAPAPAQMPMRAARRAAIGAALALAVSLGVVSIVRKAVRPPVADPVLHVVPSPSVTPQNTVRDLATPTVSRDFVTKAIAVTPTAPTAAKVVHTKTRPPSLTRVQPERGFSVTSTPSPDVVGRPTAVSTPPVAPPPKPKPAPGSDLDSWNAR